MKKLPTPSFAAENGTIKISSNPEEINKENVERAVVLGELIWDTKLAHIRYLKNEENLLYHIFRGPNIPDRFWGTGEFGLCVLTAAEIAWKFDKPHVEFVLECCRQEVYEDYILEPPHFPPYFYSSYFCVIPIGQKLIISESQIKNLCEQLEKEIEISISKWLNNKN